MIQAIVFDLDDTLLDTSGILLPLWGSSAFERRNFEKRIAEPLPLMPGASENLEKLRQRYTLFLLTQGYVHFQRQKVKSLNIGHLFEEVLVADIERGENKSDFFQELQTRTALPANALLSIGNRLSTDIRPAKKLGWMTCHFEHGEHQDELPESDFDKADFRTRNHKDLISICRL